MPEELDVVARRLVAMAELDDGTFTDWFKTIVSEAGGALAGLDNRIKTIESLARKLADLLALDPEFSFDDAADQIYDTLRFTVVADPQKYMTVRAAVLARLQAHEGTIVEERNRWAGPGYRGINVRLHLRVDQRIEVQFHTRESYAAAKATRGQYEELRSASTPPERAAELARTIDEAFAQVPIPPGAVA